MKRSIKRSEVILMRAVAVSEYGARPALVELPDPRPGPGQVLIKVRAAGMNPMDRSIADGALASRFDANFPLIMGVDVSGVVEATGENAARFVSGDEVFGQLFIPPLGSAGTYAERVAVSQDANLVRVPHGMDPATAAALPTAGGTALDIADRLGPVSGRTVLIIGAAGGVGSFLTQLVVRAGAIVITVAPASAADRMRSYGAAENIDRMAGPVNDAVRASHPHGVDVLIDLASDRDAFAALAALVGRSGTALTTRYVADTDALAAAGVTGINFAVSMTPELLARLADAVVSGRCVAPPITTVGLTEVPGLLTRTGSGAGGKTLILVDK
jgi:NADPH:quinone reductase